MTRRYDAAPSTVLSRLPRSRDTTRAAVAPPVLVVSADGVVVGVSSAVCALVGRPAAELVGARVELVAPSGTGPALAAAAQGQEHGVSSVQLQGRDGRPGPVLTDWSVVHTADTAVLVAFTAGTAQDSGIPVAGALRTSEARWRAIADTAEEGVWAVSTTGTTLYASARTAAILGVPSDLPFDADVLDGQEPSAVAELRHRLAATSDRGPERYELAYPHPDGWERRLWISSSPLRDGEGGVLGLLAMVTDITDVRRAQEQLRTSALHDSLTGLPNRTLLLDRLQHAVERPDRSTAVLFVDLDGFKLVNDSRGHRTGDELLVAVARRLVDVAGPPATVARFGGDEFVVLVEDCDAGCAQELAQAAFGALSEPFDVDGVPVHVGACIGVASAGSSTTSATDLLRYADTAMHAAKATGRGRVRVFDPALAEDVEQRYALAADLRAALADDALSLHYQPVVRLGSGQVVGMEALARWTHAERGPVPPASFVAVAELTGLSGELDRWVVRRALHDAGVLQTARAVPPGAYVAVNLSARSLADGFLDRDLPGWTAAAGLLPEQVLLEITETSIMQDTELAIGVLRSLRAQGFRVAIDDFGTGYSSLAYLRDLPITTLKVDRSFVADISTSTDALAIVASIVDLARAVGVSVIAEGVETPEQSAVLQRLGCPDGQGWLWSPAVPAGQLLATRPWMSPLARDAAAPVAGAAARRSSRGPAVTVEHGLVRLLALHRSGASLATIAAALNSEGFRSPSGARWHRSSIARAITDAAYPSLDAMR